MAVTITRSLAPGQLQVSIRFENHVLKFRIQNFMVIRISVVKGAHVYKMDSRVRQFEDDQNTANL